MVNEDHTALLAITTASEADAHWSTTRRLAHWLVPAALVFGGSMLLDTRTLMPGLGFCLTTQQAGEMSLLVYWQAAQCRN